MGSAPNAPSRSPRTSTSAQPPIRTNGPLTVVFVAANLTNFDSHLEIHGPKDVTSGPLVANGNGSFQAGLPTGSYTVSAADIPGSKPAKLTVGPYRASSQNDVLLVGPRS